jgi:hypothetical protein
MATIVFCPAVRFGGRVCLVVIIDLDLKVLPEILRARDKTDG